ncbi:hypothetical protein TWF694_004316 [Orbilia ellipsospora]|uniref:carboxypeptidase C n=1 Tax=Orbilia ellipsospora TaxID=2528407 RepID=A0AAV9WXR2_9PEZI
MKSPLALLTLLLTTTLTTAIPTHRTNQRILSSQNDNTHNPPQNVAGIKSTAGGTANAQSVLSKRSEFWWDFHIKGHQHGPHAKRSDGYLDNYALRGRTVNPGKLGVDKVKQHSGYLDNNATDTHLFYWFFESRNDPANDPIILWLSGGPGGDSISPIFYDIGPGKFTPMGEMKSNPSSWNNNASMLFLDQPVNTGFSYSQNQTSDTIAASKDVYALLTLFFEQFPQYRKQHFHITGSSYAGHWVPVFAYEILSHEESNINLKSISVGNGLTDPKAQFASLPGMACGKGGVDPVLDEEACEEMERAAEKCLSMIEGCYESAEPGRCSPATKFCEGALLGAVRSQDVSVYDLRHRKGDPSPHPEAKFVTKFFKTREVLEMLGVEKFHDYTPSAGEVMKAFVESGDVVMPYQRFVPEILKRIPMMVYAGDKDFICNWLGVREWTERLEWEGKEKFNKAELQTWKLDGKEVGQMKREGNLAFVRIYDAGHAVAGDKPEAALDMMNSFLKFAKRHT